MILAIDLDGVIYPFHEAFIQWWFAETGEELWLPQEWELAPAWDWNQDAVDERLEQFTLHDGYLLCEPIPGTYNALWQLHDEGHHIAVVTQRFHTSGTYGSIAADTAIWLDDHKLPFDSLHFITPKKSKECVDFDFLLDDRPSTITELGWKCVKFARPWNQDTEAQLTARNWQEFVDIVLNEADPMRALDASLREYFNA